LGCSSENSSTSASTVKLNATLGRSASLNGISTIDYNGITIYVRPENNKTIEEMIKRIENKSKNKTPEKTEISTQTNNPEKTEISTQTNQTINRISDSKEPTKNTITINGVQYKKNNEIKKGNKTYKIKDIIEKKILLGNNKNEYYYNINQFKNFINELPSNSEFIPYNSKIPLPPPEEHKNIGKIYTNINGTWKIISYNQNKKEYRLIKDNGEKYIPKLNKAKIIDLPNIT
jgi:hypothetical protein